MKQGVIYKVVNKVNGKTYIGLTVDFKRRQSSHIYFALTKKDKFIFHTAIRKYGIEQFEWSIIWQGNSDMLDEMERYFIKEYKTFINSKDYDGSNGYNMTEGGELANTSFDKTGTNNGRYVHKLYTFYNQDGRIEESITSYDFRKKYPEVTPTSASAIINKGKSFYGWSLNKDFKHQNRHNTFTFTHKDGTICTNVTQSYMSKTYGIKNDTGFSQMIRGILKQYKGWRLLNDN